MQIRLVSLIVSLFILLATIAYGAGPVGKVVDDQGKPVAGAEVLLHYHSAQAQLAPGSGTIEKVKTDSQGMFQFERPVRFRPVDSYIQGTESYALIATHPDYAIGWAGMIMRGKEKTSYTLIMTEPRSIEISVTTVEGKPIEGAKVYPYALGGRGTKNPAFKEGVMVLGDGMPISGASNNKGIVSVPHLPKTQIAFRASKPGYAEGLCFPGQKQIHLTKGATISGTVRDSQGKPAQDVIVHLDADWMGMDFLARTDKEGHYKMEDVAAAGWDMSPWGKSDQPGTGKYYIKSYGPSGGSNKEELQLNAGDNITRDLTITSSCQLSGKVIDSTTNKPIPNARLRRRCSDREGGRSDYLEIMADETGRFSFIVPSQSIVTLTLENSRDGDYMIDEGQGYQSKTFDLTATKDETDLELRVKLWAVQPLNGQVVNSEGKGIKATVHLHSNVPQVETDKNGKFTLKTAPTDRDFDLFAITDDRKLAGMVSLKKGDAKATISLTPTQNYSGQVQTPSELPAANLEMMIDLRLNGGNIYRVRTEPKTDAEGNFTVKNLFPKGTYYAWWSSDSKQNRDYDYGNATIELPKLKPGELIRFEAQAYINALMGRVVDEEGKPIEGVGITPQTDILIRQDDRRNRKPLLTDSQGNFTIQRLGSGEMEMIIKAEGYMTRTVKTDSDNIDLEITLTKRTSSGYIYSATVTDTDDKPMAGIPVTYDELTYGTDGRTTLTLTSITDDKGYVQFNREPDKEMFNAQIVLTCDVSGYNLLYVSANFKEDKDVQFVLDKETSCWEGVVKDQKGEPIAGAIISLTYLGLPKFEAVEYKSDSTGKFTLSRSGQNKFTNIRIIAPGYVNASEYFDPDRDKLPKSFVLSPGCEITGKVTTPNGTLIPNNMVAGALEMRGDQLYGSSNPIKVHADGTFKIMGLKPASYKIYSGSKDGKPIPLMCREWPIVRLLEGESTEVTIKMERASLVKGKIVSKSSAKLDLKRKSLHAMQDGKPVGGVLIEKDGSWEMYLLPGETVLVHNAGSDKMQTLEQGLKITVEKDKPLKGVILEIE